MTADDAVGLLEAIALHLTEVMSKEASDEEYRCGLTSALAGIWEKLLGKTKDTATLDGRVPGAGSVSPCAGFSKRIRKFQEMGCADGMQKGLVSRHPSSIGESNGLM